MGIGNGTKSRKDMIRVTFLVSRDLDAIFLDAIAKARPGWDNVVNVGCAANARWR